MKHENVDPTLGRGLKTTAPSFRPGGTIDLSCPRADQVDFRHMADRLARQIRFNGERNAISVAQHSVMGAEAIFAETKDIVSSALFVLHDGHEWVLGDLARPVHDLLAYLAGPMFSTAWSMIKRDWDIAIYRAADLPCPGDWTMQQAKSVSEMDQRMCSVEILALYGPNAWLAMPASSRKTPLLQEGLTPWPPEKAAERFLSCLSRFTGRTFR